MNGAFSFVEVFQSQDHTGSFSEAVGEILKGEVELGALAFSWANLPGGFVLSGNDRRGLVASDHGVQAVFFAGFGEE